MPCPDQCNCVKCRERVSVVRFSDRDAPDDGPDDDRERAFGGRLVKADDPRKADPADADPLPSRGLDGAALDRLNEAFDAAADATAPDPDKLAALEARLDREREGSEVDLTADDVREARMSHRERVLDRLDALVDADGAPAIRKADDDGDGDADGSGEHTLQGQDLADAVANLLGVSPGRVRDGFDALRDDDADDGDDDARRDLAERVADLLGVPVGAVLDVFEDIDGDADDGAAKATVAKSAGGSRPTLGTDRDGRAALVTPDGRSVALDALAGSGR